jgi:hypothetical protein
MAAGVSGLSLLVTSIAVIGLASLVGRRKWDRWGPRASRQETHFGQSR